MAGGNVRRTSCFTLVFFLTPVGRLGVTVRLTWYQRSIWGRSVVGLQQKDCQKPFIPQSRFKRKLKPGPFKMVCTEV